MLEGLGAMLANYDLQYIVGCELRHALASLCLVGAPLLALYLTSTMRSGAPVTSIFPLWWSRGLLLAVGFAGGASLHYAIDYDLLPWLFPSGWA